MKTLDEVIEIASDWTNGFDESSIEKQMLYYLKMFRSDMQMYSENQKYWEDELKLKIKDFGDAKERYIKRLKELDIGTLNDPLSWSELQHMEGKPVWVEYNLHIGNKDFRDNSKRWCIVREFKPWHDTEIIITENGFVLSKNEQIKCWQAYRKERS